MRREVRTLWHQVAGESQTLTFQLSKLGHLRIRVEAHEMGDDARLTFSIHADQTHLPIWRDAIMQALETFPPEV